VLVGLIALAIAGCSRQPLEVGGVEPIAVTAQAVRLATVRDAISVNGIVTPIPVADFLVFAPVPCTVDEVTKNEGDHVTAGEVVVTLNIPAISSEVATRELELNDATAKLTRVKAEADRLADLYGKGLAARVQVENARSAQSSAEAAVSQARSHMDTARALQASTVIRAKFTGVVAKRFHTAGELVQGGDADPILRIVDPARLQVAAQVPLTDGGRILVGQSAMIQTPTGSEPGTGRAQGVAGVPDRADVRRPRQLCHADRRTSRHACAGGHHGGRAEGRGRHSDHGASGRRRRHVRVGCDARQHRDEAGGPHWPYRRQPRSDHFRIDRRRDGDRHRNRRAERRHADNHQQIALTRGRWFVTFQSETQFAIVP
jgi:biotin carboxyl carrier protein